MWIWGQLELQKITSFPGWSWEPSLQMLQPSQENLPHVLAFKFIFLSTLGDLIGSFYNIQQFLFSGFALQIAENSFIT